MSTRDLNLLKQDHQKIMQLVTEIADTSERPTIDLEEDYFVHLKSLLSMHLQREDATVYRLLVVRPSLAPAITRARQDHRDIERLLSKLSQMSPARSGWGSTVHDLRTRLEHHISLEEQEFFPLVEADGLVAEARPDLHPS
jgi:iron-sulfur cluster repair protein YtfE (RIC family)